MFSLPQKPFRAEQHEGEGEEQEVVPERLRGLAGSEGDAIADGEIVSKLSLESRASSGSYFASQLVLPWLCNKDKSATVPLPIGNLIRPRCLLRAMYPPRFCGVLGLFLQYSKENGQTPNGRV